MEAAQAALSKRARETRCAFISLETLKNHSLFLSGTLVDAESYSIWAKEVSEKGYSVAIVKMPFDMAVAWGNRAENILNEVST